MRRMIVAAALAAASLSFAFAPAMANSNPPDPGTTDLGVDISSVQLTPSGVHDFLSSLAPQTRQDVEAACGTYQRYPDSADSTQTLTFCGDIHNAG
ncbi:MAG TPA: hypothetical protein VG894_10120 [Bauldia sp.]|nr:hypothetical protein [Bauldia sp.]